MVVWKGFLKEVAFTYGLKELATQRARLWGTRGTVMGLGHNHCSTAEVGNNLHGSKAESRVTGHECGGRGKMRSYFSLNCLFVSHFSNGFLAFFLHIYSSIYVRVMNPLSYITNISPNLSFSLNNAYSIVPNQSIYLVKLVNLPS